MTLRRDQLLPGDAFEYIDGQEGLGGPLPGPVVVDYPHRPYLGRIPGCWSVSIDIAGTWGDQPVRLIPRWDGYLRTVGVQGTSTEAPSKTDRPWPHTCDRCGSPALHMAVTTDCSARCCPERTWR